MKIKDTLHKRNKHRKGYELDQLIKVVPALKDFVEKTPAGKESLNWSSPEAVLLLNKALIE